MSYQLIKEKYNKPNMSDEIAKKIKSLEVINKILILGTIVIGIITILDIFTPDPIFLLDEAALAAITGFLKVASSIVKKKIALLVETNKAKITAKDIEEISKEATNTAKSIKRSRTK